MSLNISTPIAQREIATTVTRRRALPRLVLLVSLARRVVAIRARKKDITTTSVEENGEGLCGSTNIDGALPKLAIVLIL